MLNQKSEAMSSLRNRVQLIGNLGQDPEVKKLESGKTVSHFTLATDDSYKNTDGQKVSEATWHNLVAWNGLAEYTAKYLKKGCQVVIEGRLTYRSYEDKKGVTKNITEIVVSDISLLKSAKDPSKVEQEVSA